ncbi:MBL fold metallo-hydrolase [Paenibacillus sp. CAU 1782]
MQSRELLHITISIHHIRHATSILTINGKTILIDPMLSEAGQLSPVPLTRNYVRNPLIQMKTPQSVFKEVDAILLTHRHFDHWDKRAMSVLDKELPVFCQPKDQTSVISAGFSRALPVNDRLEWEGIVIKRIQGTHAHQLDAFLREQNCRGEVWIPKTGSFVFFKNIFKCVMRIPLSRLLETTFNREYVQGRTFWSKLELALKGSFFVYGRG